MPTKKHPDVINEIEHRNRFTSAFAARLMLATGLSYQTVRRLWYGRRSPANSTIAQKWAEAGGDSWTLAPAAEG